MKETNTQIDVRREKNEVRVRGDNEENVKAAVERVTEIAGESDDVISVDVALPENTNAIAGSFSSSFKTSCCLKSHNF